ncbi:MAG: hypothetical protein HC923_06850 [Myxococcales bacterium]|nr:hypothetical protein [Myxococcales bacterium]
MDAEGLKALLEAAPRKLREALFRSAGIRLKTSAYSLRDRSKEQRFDRLRSSLAEGLEVQGEVADELIRNYLGSRPELLGDALDYWKVPHRNGFTDHDMDFVKALSPAEVAQVDAHLSARHAPNDVKLYLRYVGGRNGLGDPIRGIRASFHVDIRGRWRERGRLGRCAARSPLRGRWYEAPSATVPSDAGAGPRLDRSWPFSDRGARALERSGSLKRGAASDRRPSG